MNEEEIKQMHEQARKLLEYEMNPDISVFMKKVARNYFKLTWWNIEPEEALKIGSC